MKFKFIYNLLGLLFLAFLFINSSGGRANTANWGNTGAPGDQMAGNTPVTCAFSGCHTTGNPNTIQSNTLLSLTNGNGDPIEDDGYIPGETYTAKVTVEVVSGQPTAYGFQILALNAAEGDNGDEVSNWVATSSNVQIATAGNTNRTYAEHKNPNTAENEFEMTWTAPDDLDGDVTFYFCGNGVNGGGTSSGDGASCSTVTIAKNTSTSNEDLNKTLLGIKAFPNPANDWINLDISVKQTDVYTMRLINNLGQLVQTTKWDLINGINQKMLDLQQITPGVYSIQLTNEKEVITQNIVKL